MTIQHYNAELRKFAEPVSTKIQKLLTMQRILKVADGVWVARNIPGYNKTDYSIRESLGRLECNCQGFRKYNRCSHAEAVRIYREQTEPAGEKQLHLGI